MTLPCWLHKCSINTSWICKWLVGRALFLRIWDQSITRSSTQMVTSHRGRGPESIWFLLWLDHFCSRALLGQSGHQRLRRWVGQVCSPLIGWAPSKAPVPGPAPLQGWGDQRALQKLGFLATLVQLSLWQWQERVQRDRTATAKAPGVDIRESAPKARKLPEAPLGVDPWWEEREELKRPPRKMFEQDH